MEASEKVVESYFRYVEGYFTIPNLRCKGQKEVDLIGLRNMGENVERIHVEVSVTTSGEFKRINAKPFSLDKKRTWAGSASERVKIGYFVEDKFNEPNVVATLKEYGFDKNNYQKIIVAWDWEKSVEPVAKSNGIQLIKFKDLLGRMQEKFGKVESYYSDDTVRLLQLLKKSEIKG
jgi:hypothetical protein